MTCLYSCAMEVEGETHLMMLDACLICTLVPGIPHLQEAPHPVLQAVRIGHILLRRHTGTVFLVANFHTTSPFLQTFTEWEMKLQPAVLIRICFDKVPILNSPDGQMELEYLSRGL